MNPKIELPKELNAVNIGLAVFADDLRQDGVTVVNLDWRPPAGGDARLTSLLSELCERE
jgi:hypothetical protein